MKPLYINWDEFDKNRQATRDRIKVRLKKHYPTLHKIKTLDHESGSKFTKCYLGVVENEIKELAGEFNRFGLLTALHHVIPPLPFISKDPAYFVDSQVMFVAATLAAMKYGSLLSEANPYYCLESKNYLKAVDQFCTNKNVIKKILKFEDLIFLLYDVQKAYRSAEKGAVIKIKPQAIQPVEVISNHRLNKLTSEYDERIIDESRKNLFFEAGGYSPVLRAKDFDTSIPFLTINWEEVMDLSKPPQRLGFLDLLPIYNSLSVIKEDFQKTYKGLINPDDFLAFVIGSFQILKEMILKKEQFFGLGYDFSPTNRFLRFQLKNMNQNHELLLRRHLQTSLDFAYKKLIVPKSIWAKKTYAVFDYISINEKSSKNINIAIRQPCSYILHIESEGCIFFPYNNITSFFSNLWQSIPKSKKFRGEIQGDTFMLQVNDTLDKFKNIEVLAKSGKKIKEGKNIKAEIDCLIGKGNFVFVVSCKACAPNEQYLEGVGQGYWDRWEDQKKWLKDVDKLAKLISGMAHDRLGIPLKYKFIVPLVCSSSPWYIWKDSSKFRLPNNVPRVCTLNELCDFLKNLEGCKEDLLKKQYVIKIKG